MLRIVPDYDHCVVNFSSSIMKQFMIPSSHHTIREMEKLLKYDYKNIIVINFVGLSSQLLNEHLEEDSFLRNHKIRDISSVISIKSYTSRHALELGMTPYEMNKKFFNQYNTNQKEIKDTPNQDIISSINSQKKYSGYGIFPNGIGAYKKRDEMYKRILNFSQNKEKKYIYAVCYNLVDLLIEFGTHHKKCKELIHEINKEIEQLSKELKDSIIFILSDCGYKDVQQEGVVLSNYSFMNKLVEKKVYINPRCYLFRVKEGMNEKFQLACKKSFPKTFRVISIKEGAKRNLFGKEMKEIKELGERDFILIGIGNKYFEEEQRIKQAAYTGGISQEEMLVPIIAISRKKILDRDKIRRIEQDDFFQFHELMNEYHEFRVDNKKDIFRKSDALAKTEFLSLCQRFHSDTVFVYMRDEKLVGFIKVELVTFSGNRLYQDQTILKITDLYVSKDYRRQKIGTKLYEEVIQYAKKLHIKKIQFLVWNFDQDTKKFLNSLAVKVLNFCYESDI